VTAAAAAWLVELQHCHQMRRRWRAGGGGEAGAGLAVQQRRQVRGGLGEQGSRSPARAGRRAAGVRQPLEPVPGRQRRRRERGQDAQVVGGVEGGELAQQRAGEGAGAAGRAGGRPAAQAPQRDGDRRLWQPAGPADQRLGGGLQAGVALDQRPAGGVQADGRVQRHRAAADPDGEEVVVGRAALPQPLGPADQRPEAWRVGVEVVGGGELGGRQVTGGGADLRQVGEVAGPLPAPGPAGGAPLGQAQADAQRQRGDRRAGDGGHQQWVPGPGDGEQERQRPGAAQQRHQVLQPCGRGRCRPRDRGWRRHQQLAGRERRGVGASPAVDQEAVGTRGRRGPGNPRGVPRTVGGRGGGGHRRHATTPARAAGAARRICGQPAPAGRAVGARRGPDGGRGQAEQHHRQAGGGGRDQPAGARIHLADLQACTVGPHATTPSGRTMPDPGLGAVARLPSKQLSARQRRS
jgi:hypothetical protein